MAECCNRLDETCLLKGHPCWADIGQTLTLSLAQCCGIILSIPCVCVYVLCVRRCQMEILFKDGQAGGRRGGRE